MCKTQQTYHWARGEASEKRCAVIETARERLMVHINWGWFVWSAGSGCSSQLCRGPGRQMWGPLCSLQGQWKAVRRLRNGLSVRCMCVGRDVRGGGGGGGRGWSWQPAFLSLLYHISFVLITILAAGLCREGALTYAHNLLFGHIVTCLYSVFMYQSFPLCVCECVFVCNASSSSHYVITLMDIKTQTCPRKVKLRTWLKHKYLFIANEHFTRGPTAHKTCMWHVVSKYTVNKALNIPQICLIFTEISFIVPGIWHWFQHNQNNPHITSILLCKRESIMDCTVGKLPK